MSRPAKYFTRMAGLLAEDRGLSALLPEARRLAELNRQFERAVPPGIARACRIAAIQEGEVIVFCAHGSAASRVRSQAASLLKALGGKAVRYSALKVKVRADWSKPIRPEKRGMQAAGLQAWSALAETLPEGELRHAIDRLLQHQRRSG